MHKFHFLLFTLSLFSLFLFTISCNSDSEMHSVRLIYPSINSNYLSQGYQPVFADQTEDTLAFVSTEAWELESSDNNWLHVPEDIQKYSQVKQNSIYEVSGMVTFEINTTGRKRTGFVHVLAGEYRIAAGYLQLPYLNVSRPMRIMNGSDLIVSDNDALITISDSCNVLKDSIIFTAYKDWTLTVNSGEWLKLEKTAGQTGTHKVMLDIQPNESFTDRTDTIYLTSAGITDAIPFRQIAKPLKQQ